MIEKEPAKKEELNKTKEKQITEEEALRVIAQKEQEAIQNCARELEAVLQKYMCKLVPETVLKNGDVITRVTIEKLKP